MSENTDERMDRARRIRQMREGQRAGIASRDDEADAGDGDDPTVRDEGASGADAFSSGGEDVPSERSESTPADVDGSVFDGARSGSTAGDVDEANEPDQPARRSAAATNGDAMQPETETDDGGGEDGDATGGDGADDALAAARRAAEAASRATGDGSAAGPSATPGDAAANRQGTAPNRGQAASPGAAAAGMQGPTGLALPDQAAIQAAVGDAEPRAASRSTGARGAEAREATTTDETVRVLEFTLGDEHYCLDIELVEEIVKRETVTRVPNTPECVEGVVDLRGQITTILDPKRLLEIDRDGPERLIVVFDPEAFDDQGAIGWLVDEVRQVVPIAESEVNEPPVEADYVEGVVDRDDEDEFVVWTRPEVAIRLATEEEGDD